MKGGFSIGFELNLAPNQANNFDSVGTHSIIQSAEIFDEKEGDFVRRAIISGNMLRHFLYEAFSSMIMENEDKWYLSEQATRFEGHRFPKPAVKVFITPNKVETYKISSDLEKFIANCRDADVFGFMAAVNNNTVRRTSPVYVGDLAGGKISTVMMSRNQSGIVSKKKEDTDSAATQQRITQEQASGIYRGDIRMKIGNIGLVEDTMRTVISEEEQKLRLKYFIDAIEYVYGHGNFGARRARKDIVINDDKAIAIAVKGANVVPGTPKDIEDAQRKAESIKRLFKKAEVQVFSGDVITVTENLRKFYGL